MRLAPRRKRLQASTSCACPRARWETSSVPARPSASPSRRNSESNSPFSLAFPTGPRRGRLKWHAIPRRRMSGLQLLYRTRFEEPLPHADPTALAAANRRRLLPGAGPRSLPSGPFSMVAVSGAVSRAGSVPVGYLANARIGAAFYNLAHTLVWPIALLLVSFALPAPELAPYGLIWLSHLGFDRMLGFGLKYPTNFRDTHLERV